MVTIKDVALLADVTVTTVSRTLNNKAHVSAKTRKKVLAAMKELNYQPNQAARTLSKKKSNLIGLIIPDIRHPFFAELTSYIEYYASECGYKIILCNSYKDSSKEKTHIDMLTSNQVSGIIIGSHSLNAYEYLSIDLPLVAIDRYLSENIPFIASDNYRGGSLATNLLIDKGCKKLAHISGPVKLNTPANNRRKAFIDVATSRNINYAITETKLNSFERSEYEETIISLFKRHPDIDGIFAGDMIAVSIINLSKEINKEIPKDLKIVGYDDIYISTLIRPSLTTIRQPIEQIGQKAVEVILNKINGIKVDNEIILPVTLIERDTT